MRLTGQRGQRWILELRVKSFQAVNRRFLQHVRRVDALANPGLHPSGNRPVEAVPILLNQIAAGGSIPVRNSPEQRFFIVSVAAVELLGMRAAR